MNQNDGSAGQSKKKRTVRLYRENDLPLSVLNLVIGALRLKVTLSGTRTVPAYFTLSVVSS